jgi:hypothetical protein
VKSIERYLGVDLVAFRLREAQAELSYSSATTYPRGVQPQVYTAAESLQEKSEWEADPTAGMFNIYNVTSNISFISIQFILQLTCYAHSINHKKTS